MYEVTLEVQRTLGRLESKVDALLDHQTGVSRDLMVLRERTTALEKWRWTVVGGATALAALVSFVWNFFKLK